MMGGTSDRRWRCSREGGAQTCGSLYYQSQGVVKGVLSNNPEEHVQQTRDNVGSHSIVM